MRRLHFIFLLSFISFDTVLGQIQYWDVEPPFGNENTVEVGLYDTYTADASSQNLSIGDTHITIQYESFVQIAPEDQEWFDCSELPAYIGLSGDLSYYGNGSFSDCCGSTWCNLRSMVPELSPGEIIGPTNFSSPSGGDGGYGVFFGFQEPWISTESDLIGSGYIGIRKTLSSNQYQYGWLSYETAFSNGSSNGSGASHYYFTITGMALEMTPNIPISIGDQGIICPEFETSPIDLSKSFAPVNGVVDRVQLKWYKDSPQIKYSDEDAAMCDIKAWPVSHLDPETGQAIGPVLDGDTIYLENRKKTYTDDSPKEIFKWPLKFQASGESNINRVAPNIRYKWQVRCECGHDGEGWESPWSQEKFFNTPDFDPSTGIYSGLMEEGEVKSMRNTVQLQVFPNPNEGVFIVSGLRITESVRMELYDLQGRVVFSESLASPKGVLSIALPDDIGAGTYVLRLAQGAMAHTENLIIR